MLITSGTRVLIASEETITAHRKKTHQKDCIAGQILRQIRYRPLRRRTYRRRPG